MRFCEHREDRYEALLEAMNELRMEWTRTVSKCVTLCDERATARGGAHGTTKWDRTHGNGPEKAHAPRDRKESARACARTTSSVRDFSERALGRARVQDRLGEPGERLHPNVAGSTSRRRMNQLLHRDLSVLSESF
jgi:hypothetical protein